MERRPWEWGGGCVSEEDVGVGSSHRDLTAYTLNFGLLLKG